MHIPKLLIDLALILSVAGFTTLLFTWLKQPVVLGYIVAGFLISPHFYIFPTVTEVNSINTWGEIGIAFLLFGLGLEFSFKKITKVGNTGLITSFFELIIMFMSGYFLGKFLNWSKMDCIFLGAMLSISSTTIIIKAYTDLGLMKHKVANVVFGILIFEDLIAILLLVLLSTLGITKTLSGNELFMTILKLVSFLVFVFTLGIFLIPTLFKTTKKWMNDETLLVVSIGLCFATIVFSSQQGFSSALGAFLMGTIIAETPESEKIHKLIKPLKHLFGAVFFVSVGMLVDFKIIINYTIPIICITLLILFIKTTAASIGTFIAGEPLKRSIKSGYSLGQIGEFSFIIASLGIGLKIIHHEIYPIIVTVSVITTFFTPYFIKYSENLYPFIPYKIRLYFEKKEIIEDSFSSRERYYKIWKKLLKNFIIQNIIFSVFLSIIFLLCINFISPFIHTYFFGFWYKLVMTGLSLSIMSPFIYGLIKKPSKHFDLIKTWNDIKLKHTFYIFLFLLRYFIALFFVMIVISHYFGNPSMISILVALGILGLIKISHISTKSYKKIEAQFLENLNHKALNIPEDLREELHFENFIVNPNSLSVGKTLGNLAYREKFGINIVCITRGKECISLPTKETAVFPFDKLLVVGNDTGLEALKKVEEEDTVSVLEQDNQFRLHDFVVSQHSPITNKTLSQCKIRELYKILILCIEKKTGKIINPNSQTKLKAQDRVWFVCTQKSFKDLIGYLLEENDND
ncbi:MAG: cation:proton antiporter [Chitinophagaceae bacterium]